MIRRFKQLTIALTVQLLVLMSVVLFPAPVSAGLFDDAKAEACNGAQVADSGASCAGADSKVSDLIKVILEILSIVAGIAAVIMFIVAGIRYVTSGGDSNGVSGAKNTMIYAVVGIAIVVLSQAIVQFVIKRIE